jgi:polyhydroxyalkanoate synthesis repressor PhaR
LVIHHHVAPPNGGVYSKARSLPRRPFRRARALSQIQNESSMSEERLIKKYANRRLYDASQSKHITLEDIRAMVMAGERVRVVEDKTHEDITRLILLQVIADQEQFGRPILSTPLLEALIRFYGNSLQGFLSTYLEKSVETFMRQQEQMARLSTNATVGALTELTRQNLELWAKMQEGMFAAFAAQREPTRGNGKDDAEPGQR